MSLLGHTQSPFSLKGFRQRWNWFFFESADPRVSAAVRIGYAFLLLLMLLVQWREATLWFSDAGLLPFEASRLVVDPDTRTILSLFDNTPAAIHCCYIAMLLQTALLLVGYMPRFQAVCLLVWLTSFNHRNSMILDGEDTVFRLFALLLALTPCGCRWSIDNLLYRRRQGTNCHVAFSDGWGVRLMQIQMTVIYVSTAWEKLNGNAWLDGTALYYASRLDDLFGRGPVPSLLFDHLLPLKLMTWAVLIVEVILPILLWFKETRRWALLLGLGLHLSIEWMMNLNFFEWIMLAGLVSFTTTADLDWVKSWLGVRHHRLQDHQAQQLRSSPDVALPALPINQSTYAKSL